MRCLRIGPLFDSRIGRNKRLVDGLLFCSSNSSSWSDLLGIVEDESPLGVPTHCSRGSIWIFSNWYDGEIAVSKQMWSDIEQMSYKCWRYMEIKILPQVSNGWLYLSYLLAQCTKRITGSSTRWIMKLKRPGSFRQTEQIMAMQILLIVFETVNSWSFCHEPWHPVPRL